MKKLLIFVLIFLFSFGSLYAQDTGGGAGTSSTDSKYDEEVFLSDAEFFKKYVEKFSGLSPEILLSYYTTTEDVEVKMYIVKQAGKIMGSNDNAFDLIGKALQEGRAILDYANKTAIDDTWQIRLIAATTCKENITSISDAEKLDEMCHILIDVVKNDKEERVRAASVLALGVGIGQMSDEAMKTSYITRLVNILRKTSPVFNQFAWCIIRSLGELKTPMAFFPLLEARRKGFNTKVQDEIVQSIKKIVGE